MPSVLQHTLLAMTTADETAAVVPGWVKLAITLAVFILPFLLGNLIAKTLKVREWGFKISVVLLAATLGVMPFAYQLIAGAYEQEHYEQALASWQARGENFKISEDTLKELKERRPGLKIVSETDENTRTSASAAE